MRSTVTALISLCSATTAQAQSTLPRPGPYYCYTTTTGTAARGPYAIAVLPAFFGKLIFDANGAYRFTGRTGGGRVTLNRTFLPGRPMVASSHSPSHTHRTTPCSSTT